MKFRPLAALSLLAAVLLIPSAGAQTGERQWFAGGATPTRYELSITPSMTGGAFTGEARITIESREELAAVVMNALDIEVQRATIDNSGATFDTDSEAQTLTLTPRRALRPGRHVVRIFYTGKIYDDAYGLFRVTYQADGQERHALATQFEPGDARRFAPMWDQPNMRSVFSLTVTAPSDQMVVSNMPIASAQRQGALTRTRFADTPSMASYLLFLAVGDFERVTREVDGVTLGVVVRRGQGRNANVALDAGEESLRYFTEYFGIRYPLPKLDMIGVPGASGAFGAMENWGAILYFDQYLIVDDATSSEEDRQRVFGFVSHEIAHQWFGDLVTMNWWDDLWLNEGFASWMAAKATEARHPDWQPWLSQLTDGTASAMNLDSRIGTHPIVQTVNTLDDANLAFDSITYEKGLAVIRMLEAYVGEENFRRGVRDYLNAHLYGNAETEDLWRAVQAASGQPVLEIARSFTRQQGFPVLSVSSAACTNGNAAINVSQRRYATDEVSRTNELWQIPVVAQRVGGQPVRTVLPAQANSTITVPGCGPYLVNAGQSGFFRVNYDDANFRALTSQFGALSALDQEGLLQDYWAFGKNGDTSFASYMELVNVLPADADPVIVNDTAGSMAAFASYAEGRPSLASVRAYGQRVLRPYFERVGWTPRREDTSNQLLMRSTLIKTLGALGDEQIIAEARRRVRAAASDPSALPGSIRTAVLGVYAAHATAADYDALVAQARGATDFVEQRRLWLLISGVKDEALARRTLQTVLGDQIPRQVRLQVLSGVAGMHPRMAWDFLVANRAQLETLMDPQSRLDYPNEIAGQSSDPAIATALEAYGRNFPQAAQRGIAGTAAAIRIRAETIRQRFPAVEQWIQRHGAARGATH